MNRKLTVLLICFLLAAGVFATFKYWPKKYAVDETMIQTVAFWNDRDAFIFLELNTTGRAHNTLQEKLARTRYGYLSLLVGSHLGFIKRNVVAYRLTGDGNLERFQLPDNAVLNGSWSLVNGALELTPHSYSNLNPVDERYVGFRWEEGQFVPVPAPLAEPAKSSRLSADDEDESDEDAYGLVSRAERQQFKSGGWHYKLLNGYGPGAEATLPVVVAGNSFNLTVEHASPRQDFDFEFPLFGAKSLRLAGMAGPPVVLWAQSGWHSVTKSEFELLQQKYGRKYQRPFTWAPLLILVFLVFWRFTDWFRFLISLFTLGTTKRRVLKSMATSYSFPPATPAQFPALDIGALDRYTRELEGMGFTQLLDFSLVSDSPTTPPTFHRLFSHSRHHCFGLASQFFPRGKSPLPLRCSFEGCLQDGWTIGFSNRKPQAAGSLLRRKKAIGVGMPEATSSELLQAFLKMREQVCLDLGIAPVNDDSLQAFINKTQRSLSELREAVQQKNFVKGLPEVYLRKLSLLKTKPEYVWLGDYPKEAERRKQGLSSFAAVAR